MQSQDIEYLDGEFTIQESFPNTLDELKLVIPEDSIIDEAISNLLYRNRYPRVYKLVSNEVAKTFPKAVVATKQLKDKTERKVYESDMDHLRSFLTGRKDKDGNIVDPAPEGSRETLGDLFKTIAPAQPLYVKGERVAGGGKVSASVLETANGFMAQGPDAVEKIITFIEAKVNGYKVGRDSDGNPTAESLARGIQVMNKQLEREAAKNAAAQLQAAVSATEENGADDNG